MVNEKEWNQLCGRTGKFRKNSFIIITNESHNQTTLQVGTHSIDIPAHN